MPRLRALTPALRDRIVEGLLLANTETVAARRAGISAAKYFAWKRRGRILLEQIDHGIDERLVVGEDAMCIELVQAVEQAVNECEANLVALVLSAAQEPKHWRAAWEILRTRWPERYNADAASFGRNGNGHAEDTLGPADMARVIYTQAEGFQQVRAAGTRWLRSMVTQGLMDPAHLPPGIAAQLEHLAPGQRSVYAAVTLGIGVEIRVRAHRVRRGRVVMNVAGIEIRVRGRRVRRARVAIEMGVAIRVRGRAVRAVAAP